MQMPDKQIIGLVEKITVQKGNKKKQCLARIDTGAVKSSMDVKLAAELGLGPILQTKLIKSANGTSLRPVVTGEVSLANKKIEGTFNLADRSHMRYRVLIGQNILVKNNFLIDPDKNPDSGEK